MSISNRFVHYSSKVARGFIRPGQVINFMRSKLLPMTEVVSWQPNYLSFFATSRCNLSCDMCPTHSKKIPNNYIYRHHDEPDMSLDLFRFVLDRYPNVLSVNLMGVGEPLLNPHLFDMVRESVRRQVIVDTISNGLALDVYAPDIVKSGLNRVYISVNGHTAEEFHRMTGNPEGVHSRILRNVETLVRARSHKRYPLLCLSFIIDRHNYRYMKEMIKLAEQLRADSVEFCHFLPSPFPGFTPEERCLYADDPAVVEEFARVLSKKFGCEVKWPYLLRRPEDVRNVCKQPFNVLIVDGAGNVGGCPAMMLNMHENGKVYDESTWNNQYFRRLRRYHLHGDLPWPCKYCVDRVGVAPSRVIGGKEYSRTKLLRVLRSHRD